MSAAEMLDKAMRCHDVWPLLERWARTERELEAVNLAQCAPYQSREVETELKLRSNAARKAHDEAVAALLAVAPDERSAT